MAIIKVTFDERGIEYIDDPNGIYEIDDSILHPHRWQVKDGVLVDIFDGMSNTAILAKQTGEAEAEISGKLTQSKTFKQDQVKLHAHRLIAATDWKLDKARDTGADNTDILVERQALRDKSNVIEDIIEACDDDTKLNNVRWDLDTLEIKAI